MLTVNILKSVPRSQAASLFCKLPPEIRLMIYLLLFTGGSVSAWFDGQFFKTHFGKWPWQRMFFLEGQCCFRHRGGSFALLMTCRGVYMEAFSEYWSNTTMTMILNYLPRFNEGIELQKVCAQIPAPIKAKLCHIRNVRLPVIGYARPTCDASNWAPTLLEEFPNLKTCALPHTGLRRLAAAAGGIELPDMFRITGGQYEVFVNYFDVGPFQVKTGESPAAFLERTTGIQRSSGVTILSSSNVSLPYDEMTQPDRPVNVGLSLRTGVTGKYCADVFDFLVQVLQLGHVYGLPDDLAIWGR